MPVLDTASRHFLNKSPTENPLPYELIRNTELFLKYKNMRSLQASFKTYTKSKKFLRSNTNPEIPKRHDVQCDAFMNADCS